MCLCLLTTHNTLSSSSIYFKLYVTALFYNSWSNIHISNIFIFWMHLSCYRDLYSNNVASWATYLIQAHLFTIKGTQKNLSRTRSSPEDIALSAILINCSHSIQHSHSGRLCRFSQNLLFLSASFPKFGYLCFPWYRATRC